MSQPARTRGRVALIGLDGATFRVLDPLCRDGVMPALAALRARGVDAVLRSTVPTYTPPAWVSIATGVNPGRHGIFGFLLTTPQERPEITHSGAIKAPPMWRHLEAQGLRCGVFNVPMYYPPMPVDGFMVSGGLASGWTDPEMRNFASSEDLGRFVTEMAGGHYLVDTVVHYENDWRSPATIDRILEVQRMRRRVLGALLEREDPDFLFAVFEGVDRLQHVHYQYFVEGTDWYGRPESAAFRDRALAYFAELDGAIDDLVGWAGQDGHVAIVSDHGFGPWEKTVNLNLLLAEWGYLSLPSVSRLTTLGPVAGLGQRVARRVLPRRLLHRAKAAVERGIRWEQTRAFASHVAEQGIHVNVRGALPHGVVEGSAVSAIEDQIVERLQELRDPDDGRPVTDRVLRRSEVVHGPFADRAPHLFPFLRDQRYELSDTLAASGPFTDHRDRPWGYHHTDGVFVAAGPNAARGRHDPGLDIVDVLPTVFHLAGLAVPNDLDGSVVSGVLSEAAASRPASVAESRPDHAPSEAYPFSEEEEAEIEEKLRGLGYLE